MTEWAEVFLGVIAAATLVTAIGQIGLLVAAGRLALRIQRLTDRVERELAPLFEHVNAIGRDASRAASLAAAQVERADRVFADVADRFDRFLNSVQAAADSAAREGTALLAGVRAAVSAIRNGRGARARARAEDEEGLFI